MSSENAIFLVADNNQRELALVQARYLRHVWGCDIHVFIETGEPGAFNDRSGKDGLFVHENLLMGHIPADAPVRCLWPVIIYGRIFAPQYLAQYRRLIYLDTDIFPVCAEQSVFRHDLPHGIGAVQDAAFIGVSAATVDGDPQKWPASVGLTSKVYFNSGVLVIDPAIWNRIDMQARLQVFIEKYGKLTMMPDQDFLNWVFEDKWVEFSPSFNFQRDLFCFGYDVVFKPVFVHFTGKEKPWIYSCSRLKVDGQFCDLYQKMFDLAGIDMRKYRRQQKRGLNGVKSGFRRVISGLGYCTRKERRAQSRWQPRAERWYRYFDDVRSDQRFVDAKVPDGNLVPDDLCFDGENMVRNLVLQTGP